jgi:hypothetical protein
MKAFILFAAGVVLVAVLVGSFWLQRQPASLPEDHIEASSSTPVLTPEVTYKTYHNEVFGFSFTYPSDLRPGNEEASSEYLYLEFCSPASCGMAASEFLIVQKTDAASIEESGFDYTKYWRYIGLEPLSVTRKSTTSALMLGDTQWTVRRVDYSSGGAFIWYQTLHKGILVSFVLFPFDEKQQSILSSFEFDTL